MRRAPIFSPLKGGSKRGVKGSMRRDHALGEIEGGLDLAELVELGLGAVA